MLIVFTYRRFINVLLVSTVWLLSFQAWAASILGGFIAYECAGNGHYTFQLTVYSNCIDTPISDNSATLKLWNHPMVSSLTVNRIATKDISLVGLGSACFNCSSTPGVGASEEITFKSAPIELSGVPPLEGWILTFDDFDRPAIVTNLQDASTQGITLIAKIFNVNAQNNLCHDRSPRWLQTPHFVGCVGVPFSINAHPVDDLSDSLFFAFDQPLAKMNSGTYSPNSNPLSVAFLGNFTVHQPTPSTIDNSGNQNAQIDPQTGEITFLSQSIGNFNIKIKVRSFRNGQPVSETSLEFVVSITTCSSANSPPIIAPPFSGSFQTVVLAGSMVSFSLNVSDPEWHPSGSGQAVNVVATSDAFGPNPSVNAGCAVAPCPTLAPTMPIVGVQNVAAHVKWQTSCDHLLDANGNERDTAVYRFVFRIQDDVCPIPAVVFKTVTIKLINAGVIPPTKINCIQGLGNTGFQIDWQSVADPNGTFVAYELHSVQSGLIATISDRNTTSYTHSGINSGEDYFIAVVSGCGGKAYRYSDTLSGIFLNVNNVNIGVAALSWNKPNVSPPSGATHFYIHREYPSGTWTLIDSVPWSATNYSDIISICNSFLNYQISVNATPCAYLSTVNGNTFTDQTPPDIPFLTSVSIDTATHQTTITWNAPPQSDTYGYIVYIQDPNTNFLIELDTVFGKNNTVYTYFEPYTDGPATYTVAAFDSCPSPLGDPFNLSARDPNFHTTIFVHHQQQICDSYVTIHWSKYGGWEVDNYDVFIKKNGDNWSLIHTTDQEEYAFLGEELQHYTVVIRANKVDSFTVTSQLQPAYSVIRSASVHADNQRILIDYVFDTTALITKIALQRQNENGFETIQEINEPQSPHIFTDEDVDPNQQSYSYRVVFYDSCGNIGTASNIGKTILLEAQIENTQQIAYLVWSHYQHFIGNTASYILFRRASGYSSDTLGSVDAYIQSFEDNVYDLPSDGKICYRVEAIEANNVFDDPQMSLSNEVCVLIDPILYIANAFSPDGKNPIFAPVLRNHIPSGYKMTIINRWGQVVFQTDNPLEGWNGKVDNTKKNAESTTYIYIIEIDNGYGEQIVTRGHVTLLR